MDLSTNELYAYIAGLVDADGSITIVNRNYKNKITRSYRVKVSIYNCNDNIVNYLLNVLGGKKRSNNINKTHTKWRNCLEYSAQDRRATNLIENILPFLIVKQKQAVIALRASRVKNQHSSSAKRWNSKLMTEYSKELAALKEQINILNVRGTKKEIEPMDTKSIPFNVSYLAGFCDGDGSILIARMGKQLCPRITFTNTNKNIIDWIDFHLHGNLYIKKRKNDKWNTSYELSFPQNKAAAVAKLLHPYLFIKKRQSKLILTFSKITSIKNTSRSIPNFRERKRELKEKIKIMCNELNKKSI